jgi:hypothetical protein
MGNFYSCKTLIFGDFLLDGPLDAYLVGSQSSASKYWAAHG